MTRLDQVCVANQHWPSHSPSWRCKNDKLNPTYQQHPFLGLSRAAWRHVADGTEDQEAGNRGAHEKVLLCKLLRLDSQLGTLRPGKAW